MNSIFARRSIRKYEDTPVEEEKNQKIAGSGHVCPHGEKSAGVGIYSSNGS